MKHGLYTLIIFIASILAASAVHAEASRPTASNPLAYLMSGAPMGYAANGTAMLPQSVLQGAINGSLTPAYQFSMGQHMLNQARDKEIQAYAGKAQPNTDPLLTVQRRTPHPSATQRQDQIKCRASKVFMQSVLSMYLPMLSLKPANGGVTSQAEQSKMAQRALTIATQARPSDACARSGLSGGGQDQMLFQIFAQLR